MAVILKSGSDNDCKEEDEIMVCSLVVDVVDVGFARPLVRCCSSFHLYKCERGEKGVHSAAVALFGTVCRSTNLF